MDFSTVKSLTIPEGEVIQISAGDTVLWKSGHTNLVPLSTEADGITIYNGGLGYKDGYRVRSGGAETAQSTASCTGFIPVKAGDTVRLSGWDLWHANGGASNAINVFDTSHTNLGQAVQNRPSNGYGFFDPTYASYGWNSVIEESTGIYKWVVPPEASIAYMRVTGYTDGDGSKMTVTVNEEIT